MSDLEQAQAQVAVFIDFDNIVMSRYDELHGHHSFRDDNASKRNPDGFIRQRLVEARVDIGAVMEFASSFGTVAVSRSYADWSNTVNASYAGDLLRNSVDLVQMFPVTSSKNGADIRLAIDVIDDLSRFPYLTHVVIVAGDSDYMSLAQRCKRLGRRVIGVGAARSVGQFFRASCDEFRYYGNLPSLRATHPEVALAGPGRPRASAASTSLLVRAANLLAANASDEWLSIGGVKGQMLRLDATFDENALGFRSFTEFLRSQAQAVETRWPEGVPGGQMRLVGRYAEAATPTAGVTIAESIATVGGPEEPDDIITEIWKSIGLLTGPGAPQWEGECIAAIRHAWRILKLADRETTYITPPAKEVLASLGGHNPTTEQRRAVHTVFGLLPWLGRDNDTTLKPNPEFVSLDEHELLDLLRQSIASRAQHKLHPQTVSASQVATAIFGSSQPPAAALVAYSRAIALLPVQVMSDTLRPQLLAAPVLWDVAKATSAIPKGQPVATVDALAEALSGPLDELDRDPDAVPMQEAFAALTSAGVLAAGEQGGSGALFNQFEDAATAEIVEQIARSWIAQLRQAGQVHSQEPMWLESFYRLALPDRLRLHWRAWVRDLI